MRFQVIEEALRRVGQFDDELFIERIEVCLSIEAHDSHAVAPFDAHIVQLHENAPSELFTSNPSLLDEGISSATGALATPSSKPRTGRKLDLSGSEQGADIPPAQILFHMLFPACER